MGLQLYERVPFWIRRLIYGPHGAPGMRGYPDALAKAVFDQSFDYALRLRTGEMIEFVGATPRPGGWVYLNVEYHYDPVSRTHSKGQHQTAKHPYLFARGVDVRVSDIVWVADAPNGS